MLAASTASMKGSSSDSGIIRLRKPVCRTAHTTGSRMAPWWPPYPDVPKEAMRSNGAAWASRRRPNARVNHPGGSPVFARSSRAAGSSLWSAKTVPLAKKADVREWHRPARQRFTHIRHEGPAAPRQGSTPGRWEHEADGGLQGQERRSGVGHHTEVGGVQRLASAAQLLHGGDEFRRPAVGIYHRRRHPIPRSIGAPLRSPTKAAHALADRRRFRRWALRDVPAGSSPASIW
eukprot:jgi/Tetstr1/462856/TSEL_007805.t1